MTYRAVPGRVRVLALAVLLVLALLAAPGAVGSDGVDSSAGVGDRVAGPLGVATADSDNETTRHRNPSEYSEGDDQEGLAAALERQLRQQLGQGAIELSEGEYDQASEYVGESFEQQLSEYVDVADDTGREETAEELQAAQDDLRNLSDARRQYEDTREEYEAAREAGDDQRARELARELERLAEQIDASSESLADHTGAVEGDAGGNGGGGSDAARDVGDEVAATQEAIRAETFEETRLSVETGAETASYTDPLRATGTLATADGDPIGGETVRLDVGNQSLSVETAADGSFAFSYRPISVPVDAESVSVAYVPENASAYLGSEDSVSVSIAQETPAITDPSVVAIDAGRSDGDGVTYGDTVTVSATVTVDGGPVENLPLVVRLGEEPLGLFETDAAGRLEGSVRVPASVPDGERDLTVALPFEDRALTGASASTTVSVAETTPDLTVTATEAGDGEAAVNGTLAADGDGVANQSVAIAVDGEPLATAVTDADGRFGTVVALPESADGDVTVTASLSGSGTNLEPAEASATVAAPAGGSSGPSIGGVPAWLLGLGLALLAPAGWWLWRRRGAAADSEPTVDLPVASGDEGSESSDPAATVLLSRAQDAVGTDRPEEAIQAAYGAVRRHLGGGRDGRTHWEFYRDAETADPDSLRALTEDYERATFDPDGVDGSTADRALSLARSLCGDPETVDERGGISSGDD